MHSVPFSIDEYEGFLQTRGIVRIEEEAVVLEFKKKEGVLGIPVSGITEKYIPISELHTVSFKKKFLGARLIIAGHKMSTFAEIPGCQHAEVILSITRQDREAAQDLASNLSLRIAEAELRQVDNQ